MAYEFSPMSTVSPGSVRSVSLDVTAYLETSEVLSSQSVVSGDSTILQVSGVTDSGDGKSVLWTLTVLSAGYGKEEDVALEVQIVGDAGNKETFEIIQPLVPRITE